VHARLDRKDLELIDCESRPRQVERVHDLGEIFADQDDVASPEGDAHPVPAGDLRHARDRALDPHRLTGRLVGEAANLHVERIARLHAFRPDRLDGRAIGDRGNQHVGQVLRDHLLQHPRRRARAVGMVGQHHGPRAARHRLLGELDAVGDGMHRRRLLATVMPTSGTSAKGKPKKTLI
jgi:hypothetical protein